MENLFKNFSKAALLLLFVIFAASCKKEKEKEPQPTSIMPARFSIDLPESISSDSLQSLNRISSNHQLEGDDIYKHLRVFIHVGEFAAEIMNNIITTLSQVTGAGTISETGGDGRLKFYKVVTNWVDNSGVVTWEFKLDGFDIDPISGDSSQAVQVYWNRNPIRGTAILNPYNMNRNEENPVDLKFRIEYSEDQTNNTNNYEKQMIVSLTNIDSTDQNWMKNFKMFVGKTGDVLYLWGNSHHPYITIIDTNYVGGKNWAFVAHGNDVLDIGVASVALPPSNTLAADWTLTDWLTNYSIDTVLTQEIFALGITDTAAIDAFLKDSVAPGYFVGPTGWVSSGTTVPPNTGFTNTFIDLSGLMPYVPNEIANLTINWQ